MRTFGGSWLRFVCCSVLVSALLTACGGGGGSGSSTSAQGSATPAASSTTPSQTPGQTQTPASSSPNAAPTISGSAQANVTAGEAYSFTPKASDAEGDAITFTIANKPVWAAFNATTGALTGTPATKDVGTYPGIEIAATDGNAVTALPAFAISVVAQVATNAVSVSWSPPTQNEDGSALTDLKGYKIHYGTATKAYTDSVAVDNAGLTRYDLESLPKGTVYIAMTAVNAEGAESEFSSEVKVTVN